MGNVPVCDVPAHVSAKAASPDDRLLLWALTSRDHPWPALTEEPGSGHEESKIRSRGSSVQATDPKLTHAAIIC